MLRRMALILGGHARWVLWKRNAFWAEGIEQEIHHIRDDRAALSWAAGCVFASYREALRSHLVNGILPRAFLAALIFYLAGQNVVGPAQALGCYVHLSASALDVLALFPDDRIICVYWPSVPLAVQAASLLAGGLFALSAIALIGKKVAALRWFALAFLPATVTFALEQVLPALRFYSPSVLFGPLLTHVLIGRAVIPLLIAMALYLVAGTKTSLDLSRIEEKRR